MTHVPEGGDSEPQLLAVATRHHLRQPRKSALGLESRGQLVPQEHWAKRGLRGPWPNQAVFLVRARSLALSKVLKAQLV